MIGAALVVIGLAATVSTVLAQTRCPEEAHLDGEARVGEFVVQVSGSEHGDGCVQVLRGNAVVFSLQSGAGFRIGSGFDAPFDGSSAPSIPVGADITGLGKPNLILVENSGGAHCCFSFHVLEFGDRVRDVAAIDVQDSSDAFFVDLDHDGVYELVAHDYTFAYWHTSFADSPAPRIVLRFDGRRYVLALDLMRTPAPKAAVFGKMVSEVRDSYYEDENPARLLWETMLDLIYTRHPDLAWKVIRATWESGRASRKEFLGQFCHQFAKSPYFETLRPTLGKSLCGFDGAQLTFC